MRYFLVCNPGSRGRRGGRLAETYREMLALRGAAFDSGTTCDMADAERQARAAAAAGFDAVVAVGGDGTISRVASGLLKGGGGRVPHLGVLYAGTSPDFCRFHGLPIRPEEAVDALLSGRSRAVDVGRLRCRGADGRERSEFLVCSANLGLGAGIAARANRYRVHLGDFLGTLTATMATVAGSRPHRCRLVADGREEMLEGVLNVTVGKNPFLAGGLKLRVDAGPSDGRLYFFAVGGLGRLAFLLSLPRLYSGSIVRDRRFRLGRAGTVRVEPLDAEVEVECDGDPAGFSPVEVSVVPGALSLLGAS